MGLNINLKFAACALLCALSAPGSAAVAWDEALAGDFANNGLAPTPVTVAPGSNVIKGSTGNSGQGIDRDYFTFNVPAGAVLSAIWLLDNTSVSGDVSFIGIQAGPQLTVTPTGGGAQNLLGFAHYGRDQIGQNLLPAMAIQFAGSLPSGAYSVWVQDTGGVVDYGFDFVITAVAEPGAGVLMGAGLLGLAVARRRMGAG